MQVFTKNILNNLLIFLAENGHGDNGRKSFWQDRNPRLTILAAEYQR
jgi:hypothetical protein